MAKCCVSQQYIVALHVLALHKGKEIKPLQLLSEINKGLSSRSKLSSTRSLGALIKKLNYYYKEKEVPPVTVRKGKTTYVVNWVPK